MKINFKVAKLTFFFCLLFIANTYLLADDGTLNKKLEDINIITIALIILIILLSLVDEITSYFYRFKKEHAQEVQNMTHEKSDKSSSNTDNAPSKASNQNRHHSENIEHFKKISEDLNNMREEFNILRNDIEEKDKEIARYKDGYDASMIKNYFSKFTFLDSVIKEYIDDNEIDLDGLKVGLKDIQVQMNEAFSEYDIEIFSPQLGADYRKTDGVEHPPRKIETNNKEDHFAIAEVIQPGYRRKITNYSDSKEGNASYQYITDAKVAIYLYKESE